MIPCSRLLQIVIGCPPHVDIVKFVSELFSYFHIFSTIIQRQVGREMPELVRLFVIVQLLCGYISDEVHSHNARQCQVIGWSGHLYRMSCTSQWTLTKMFEGSTCGVSVRGGGRWQIVGIIGKHVYLMLYVVLVCTLCIVLFMV